MKLNIQSVRGKGARLAKLTDVGRHSNHTIETPACMLYTRMGSAPHLSSEMLKRLQNVPPVAHMPLTLLAQYQETIAGFKDGMAKFAALPDPLVFTSVYDPAVETPSGFSDNTGVGVFGKGGKVKLDAEGFIKIQEAILPDWFQCMSDCDTNQESGKKRVRKSVDRTLNFLDKILELHKQSERLHDTSLFGSLVGGYDLHERERSVKETVARNVDGYVLEGFHSMGPKSENFTIEDIRELLEQTIKHIPEDRPRLMLSSWRPDAVLAAVELGIDLFDTSYPYLVTERGSALVFDFQYEQNPESDNPRRAPGQGFSINLKEPVYTEDFGPLLQDCTCYSCTNFTCAYVSHLLNTSELLASILLMIHNFHHYFEFFSKIRESLANNRFEDLKALINAQIEKQTDT